MGVVLYFDGVMLILGTLLSFMGIEVPVTPIIAVLVISLIFMTLYMQRYDGNLFDEDHKLKKGVLKGFLKKGSLSMVAILVVLIAVFVSTRPLVVEVSDEALVIKGMYGMALPLDEIEEVLWLETLPKIEIRTNGAAIGPYLKGHFQLEAYGASKLFVNKGYPNYILVQTKDQVIIFNMELTALKRIYTQLIQK